MIEELAFLSPASFAYLVSAFLYEWFLAFKSRRVGRWATLILLVGWGAHSLALAVRWVQAGRPPMANLFEFLLFYIWLLVIIYLVLEYLYKQKVLGAFVVPLVLLLLGVALLLPKEIGPLPLILRSSWLPIHVGFSFVAYTFFSLGFAASVIYLLQERQLKGRRQHALYYRLPPLGTMEQLSHRFVQIGFPFLVLAVLTGALWAQAAWGSYWHWEPKQTTSLVALLLYAAYFHAHAIAGWRGRRGAWLIVASFAFVLAAFLGVNFLAPGRHDFSS